MKLQSFYLFYFLTVLLLVFGIATEDKTIISAGWHTQIYQGYWYYVIPTATLSLVTAITYHYFYFTTRPVKAGLIFIHFIVVVLGLVLVLNFYKTILSLSILDPTAIAVRQSLRLMAVLTLILLILSLVIFVIGLMKAHRERTSTHKFKS
jgi:hypothetical protein